MSLWVQPHIYHTNPQVEKQWKDNLQQASLKLTSTLTAHYAKVIQTEQANLEKMKTEITSYLNHLQAAQKQEAIVTWKLVSKQAEDEARKLGESLRESRDNKLFRKRKRTESMTNLPAKRQPLPQGPNDLIQVLTGLIEDY